MGNKFIPKQKLNRVIPNPKKPEDANIKFTFEHLIVKKEFNYHGADIRICEFIDRLLHHSKQKKIEFIAEYSGSTRNHLVVEEKVIQNMDIDNIKDIYTENVYQFKMGGKGRIFGFFIDELFVVRLIDVNHIGYSKNKS